MLYKRYLNEKLFFIGCYNIGVNGGSGGKIFRVLDIRVKELKWKYFNYYFKWREKESFIKILFILVVVVVNELVRAVSRNEYYCVLISIC